MILYYLGTCCGLWIIIVVAMIIWFAYLHRRGELVADMPDGEEI